MITHPQVQPYSTTLIKTGIEYKKQITVNVILIHLNTCVWVHLLSSLTVLASTIIVLNFYALLLFGMKINTTCFLSWELLITRLNLYGEI